MEFILHKAEHFTTNTWQGGTTTELFIFPLTANYKERDFEFRLSTATVEVNESSFTSLPGISRKLMILDGKITIQHEGRYSKELNKFNIDSFEGDWHTSSVGMCTDFNLMISGKITGELDSLIINQNESRYYSIKKTSNWVFAYVHAGSCQIHIRDSIITLEKGDLLVIHNPTLPPLPVKSINPCELIWVEVDSLGT
jgi:environmental stress-induced protein Ves